jgi:hypothetical protein
MAAKNRPAKCLYYYKGYCLYSKDKPNKTCDGLCEEYVHYDLDKKHKVNYIAAFSDRGGKDGKEI